MADDPAGHARRAGPARRRSTACRSRAPGGPTRCRSPRPARTTSTAALLEEWLRSYRPEELFDADGPRWRPTARLAPDGAPPDEREPARQRRPAAYAAAAAGLPRPRRGGDRAGRLDPRAHPGARPATCVDVMRDNDCDDFRIFGPDETASNRLDAVYEVDRQGLGRRDPAGRRAPRPLRPGGGDPLRAHLPGLAGGLPADRAARALLLLRGLHPPRRLDVQPARQVAQDHPGPRLAAADRVA